MMSLIIQSALFMMADTMIASLIISVCPQFLTLLPASTTMIQTSLKGVFSILENLPNATHLFAKVHSFKQEVLANKKVNGTGLPLSKLIKCTIQLQVPVILTS